MELERRKEGRRVLVLGREGGRFGNWRGGRKEGGFEFWAEKEVGLELDRKQEGSWVLGLGREGGRFGTGWEGGREMGFSTFERRG